MPIPKELAFLPDGVHRIVCPHCHGGSSNEKSLSVELSGTNARWYCFRASCGWAGYNGKIYKQSSTSKFCVVDEDKPNYDRFPIYDNYYNCQGWEYRGKWAWVKPKRLRNVREEWCGLHFPSRVRTSYALLVEDRASAERMFPYFPTIALLGTNLNADRIKYLVEEGITYGIIGLDEDASAKAVKMLRTEAIIQAIILLKRDLKNESTHNLLRIAGELDAIRRR